MKIFYLIGILGLLLSSSCQQQEEDNYTAPDPVYQNRSVKRGVSFNYQLIDDVNLLGQGISWSYNWASSLSFTFDQAIDNNQIDYCPMAWNGVNASELRTYVAAHPNCEYLLAFNEPNLTDQANMTPTEAAAKWDDVKSIADELNLKIISPAMNYGTLDGYSDPIVWLDEFFSLVSIDDVDGIAVHCYMANAGSLKLYIERYKKYNKPIWLTEFCAWDGLNSSSFKALGQQQYLSDAVNYLEGDSSVYRYAWFIPRASGSADNFPYNFLLQNNGSAELTTLGKIFVQMSSLDKSIYYVEQQTIEAEHYSSICIAEAADGTWVNGPKLRVTTDAPNESLELYNFLPGQWVEYQIQADRTKNFLLELRYACFVDSELEILIDGESETAFTMTNTGKDYIWSNADIPIGLIEGKHTLRIGLTKGTFCLNWLKFE